MNKSNLFIKRALISVSNKTGVLELARILIQHNIEIISTGGTCKLLREANIPVREVSEITDFPEMMDGRIKTLHPKVHGGILGQRDQHAAIAKTHGIDWIDLVVVNLYPFSETIQNPQATFEEAIENIDIGGPTMIRAAAKNMGWVGVVVDPADYTYIITELTAGNGLSFATRQQLATKAFQHTAVYDQVIYDYLSADVQTKFPVYLHLHLEKLTDLRYGENPHQDAAAYQFTDQHAGILSAKQHQGKELSYNNITDADAAVACVREFSDPTCVIVKHANPCGVATTNNIQDAFEQAFLADAVSAFGGIVAINRICDAKTAEKIAKNFIEVLIAPGYSPDALAILANKANLRVLEFVLLPLKNGMDFKFVEGGVLLQDKDSSVLKLNELKIVTELHPTVDEVTAMRFAWPILKQIKSNAILIAKNNLTLGIGAGQVSRVDAVDIALKKAGKNSVGAILASDAFFPFRDSIDRLVGTGIRAIIQPGGSVRDAEVIAACHEQKIAMVFTGKRCFKH